ncbi:hypothetical protein WDW86_08100, partial [Bdellovibrionota bacterium FG-2]
MKDCLFFWLLASWIWVAAAHADARPRLSCEFSAGSISLPFETFASDVDEISSATGPQLKHRAFVSPDELRDLDTRMLGELLVKRL